MMHGAFGLFPEYTAHCALIWADRFSARVHLSNLPFGPLARALDFTLELSRLLCSDIQDLHQLDSPDFTLDILANSESPLTKSHLEHDLGIYSSRCVTGG